MLCIHPIFLLLACSLPGINPISCIHVHENERINKLGIICIHDLENYSPHEINYYSPFFVKSDHLIIPPFALPPRTRGGCSTGSIVSRRRQGVCCRPGFIVSCCPIVCYCSVRCWSSVRRRRCCVCWVNGVVWRGLDIILRSSNSTENSRSTLMFAESLGGMQGTNPTTSLETRSSSLCKKKENLVINNRVCM